MEKGWTKVSRRSKGSVFDRLGRDDLVTRKRSQFDELRKISTNIYVTNFPFSVTVLDMHRLCAPYGTVVDVYFSKRLSKAGEWYGFVRFLNVDDEVKLIEQLRNIWMGSYKLFASAVIHDQLNKEINQKQVTKEKVRLNRDGADPAMRRHPTNAMAEKTFASVVAPKINSVIAKPNVIHLISGEYIFDNQDHSKVCLAREKQFSSLPVMMDMCTAHGFSEVDIRYVGGMWIMMEFQSATACNKFRSNEVTRSWFNQVLDWSKDFVSDHRLVWLDIEGVPLRAWSRTNFKKLAMKWGSIVYMDDNLGVSLASNRVCIETTHMGIIAEEVPIMVNDTAFVVRVRELTGWVPTFKEPQSNVEVDERNDNRFEDIEKEDGLSNNSLHAEDEADEAIDQDPFSLFDLIRQETEKAKQSRMEKEDNGMGPMSPHVDVDNCDSSNDNIEAPICDSSNDNIEAPICNETNGNGDESYSLSHPPGFTNEGHQNDRYVTVERGGVGGSFNSGSVHQIPKHSSVVEGLDLLIDMGLAMGFSMQGCLQDKIEALSRIEGKKVSQ